MSTTDIKYWAIVELLGHVRMAGKVTEVERFGAKVGRIDIPDGPGFRTQFFGGASLYRETPCSEDVARAVAAQSMPEPIHTWEMPRLAASPEVLPDDFDHPEEDAERNDDPGYDEACGDAPEDANK